MSKKTVADEMPILENGYTAMGWRKIGEDVWYPHWSIETETDNVFAPKHESVGLANATDLMARMKELSKENPGKAVQLVADARIRIRMVDGVVTADRKYEEFYFVESEEDKQSQDIFNNLYCVDHDGMGKYLRK